MPDMPTGDPEQFYQGGPLLLVPDVLTVSLQSNRDNWAPVVATQEFPTSSRGTIHTSSSAPSTPYPDDAYALASSSFAVWFADPPPRSRPILVRHGLHPPNSHLTLKGVFLALSPFQDRD
jgi:hypothetical protein